MRVADGWKDYKILDCSSGEKLEKWGDYKVIRPDPQIIWNTPKDKKLWNIHDGHYLRSSEGGGQWFFKDKKEFEANISYKNLKFLVYPTGFKHMGLFPEQSVNWEFIKEKIKLSKRPIKILNLFGYTGAATLAASSAGAEVCHVDASKKIIEWGKNNSILSKLSSNKIRWIVDDCEKFVIREIRRKNFYDGIIMDPPSYGRGPNGEIWKLEESIYNFVSTVVNILSDNPLFFILNSYTSGLSPSVMDCILKICISKKYSKGNFFADEIGIPIEKDSMILPCGSTAIWHC